MVTKLRQSQTRDYSLITDEFKKHWSVLFQSPTGTGKSVVIEKYITDNKKDKIIFLAHKRELIFQMEKRLKSSGLKVGIIIGNIEKNINANIILASVRTVTLEKRISSILNKEFDHIIIDEAHHVRTNSYENVIDNLKLKNPNIKLFGVTATPYRPDKKALNKYFDVLICSNTIKQFEEEGFLAKFRVFYTPALDVDEEVKKSGNDYQIQSLSDYMRKPQMLQFMVDSYKKFGEDKQMIIFCVDKRHAKDVRLKYEENGYKNIAYIDSDTSLKDRAKILLDFEKQLIQIIICIETLTEGIDLPETKVIQLGRPTKSIILYLQMVGRGGRPKKDKSECILLDNAGCTLEHKMPNSPRHWSLNPEIDPSNPNKKNRVVGKRKDGTFTDDTKEMEFLELVEMTPEEYATNIEGGIEKSKQINKDYDNKCRELLKEIGNYVLKILKNPEFYLNVEYIDSDYLNDDEVHIKDNKNNSIEIKYDSNWRNRKEKFLTVSHNKWGDNDKKDSLNKLSLNIVVGKLSEELLKTKNYNHIINLFEEIKDLQDSKIDINNLEKKAAEFEKEQLLIKLKQYVITNNEIELNSKVNLSKYFRTDYYNSNYFKKIKFTKNKLMSTNEIIFICDKRYGDSGTVEITKQNVKPEKLIEILEDGDWK